MCEIVLFGSRREFIKSDGEAMGFYIRCYFDMYKRQSLTSRVSFDVLSSYLFIIRIKNNTAKST